VEITAAELKTRLEAGEAVKVVDIREAGEFAARHITGAENLPVYDAICKGDMAPLARAAEQLSGTGSIVTVCRRGRASLMAAKLLRSMGHDAWSLTGGMRDWESA